MASSFTACKSLSVIDGRLADHSHRHVFALKSAPSAVSFSSSPSGFYALRASKVSLQWASSKSSLLWVSPIRQGGLKKVAVMVNASEDVEEIVEEVEEETSSGFDENFGGRQFVEPPEEAKLYVGNLPFDVNEQMLGELFEGAGQVLDVNVSSRKTWYPKAADHENVKKTWYIVDATDKRLGRLASTIAIHIRGKNLPTYTPSVDMGEYVIVVNAENIAVTGNKRSQKVYKRFSGRPGGLKEETFDCLQKRIPERIIEHAVRGMLPKGRLGRRLFTHLKVYKGPNHPHEA